MPWTSIDWCENWLVIDTKSRAISTGYWNVMLGSSLPLLRQPFCMLSCQTMVLSHCWLVLRSAAWFSVLFRYAGKASVSCFCRADRYAGEQSLRVLFQREMNMSSKGRKRETRCMKPVNGGVGSVGSSLGVGRAMVA